MIELEEYSGLPLRLDDTGQLQFSADICIEETRVRKLEELAPVCLDPSACQGSETAYDMYNGVYLEQHSHLLQNLPLRYELTLIPPRKIGHEYIKTLGHIHIPEPVSGIDYPEIVEVLVGKAHFFFQTLDPEGPDSNSAFYVEVSAGEKMIIPPGYDHLTINPGSSTLLFSDVIDRRISGIYDRIKKAHGAAYLEIDEAGQSRFIPNPFYRSVPPLENRLPTPFPELALVKDRPLYTALVETRGEKWKFLSKPSLFVKMFPQLGQIFH